jgi:hypothetical protein
MRYKALGIGNGEWGIGKNLQMYLTDTRIATAFFRLIRYE